MLTAGEKSAGPNVQTHNAAWVITITRDDITLAIAGLGAALGIMNSAAFQANASLPGIPTWRCRPLRHYVIQS